MPARERHLRVQPLATIRGCAPSTGGRERNEADLLVEIGFDGVLR
jgi:hypothetical protein